MHGRGGPKSDMPPRPAHQCRQRVMVPSPPLRLDDSGTACALWRRVQSPGGDLDWLGRSIVSRPWTTIDSLVRSMCQPVPLTGLIVNALRLQAKLPWPLSHAGHRDGCFQMWDCLSCTGDCSPAPVDPHRVSSSCKQLPCSTAASTLLLLPTGTTLPWNPRTVCCCAKC
jgi:hypothetical protein